MGSAPSAAPLPLARLVGVGAVVFLANAALLVLQLVASRLLAPFIGSDLYTWTSIIGVFLAGIALGNAYGGKLADRYPSPRTLAALLAVGAVAALWMVLFPILLTATGGHRSIPLGLRIPLLTAVLCLPAGFVLSLLTPLAIKLGLPDVSKTGRVAGLVFALSTLGCLLGNYVTGFYLIPAYTINTLVYVAAGLLLALAAGTFVVLTASPANPLGPPPGTSEPAAKNAFAFPDIRRAYLIVFLSSFCGMTLELVASRLIAPFLGQSLYTWTGIIGVMLAGTALGNLAGGLLADRVNRPGSGRNPRVCLAATLIAAGGAIVFVLVATAVLTRSEVLDKAELVEQVLGWTFALFFLPMLALGMVSPQVIRLAVPDVAHAGRTAGRVYAWSTAGAIAGTFATGYVLISTFGVHRTILVAAGVVTLASLLVVHLWKDARATGPEAGGNVLLYALSIVLGGITGGVILTGRTAADEDTVAVLETNYYKITVSHDRGTPGALKLTLDHLVHSSVDPTNPTFIYYDHEQIQMEFLRAARTTTPAPKVLVVGGGGYTFPRFAKELLPETEMDVVEIDPGVTKVAYEQLGLKREYNLGDYNMDGRQFVAERAAPHSYDLVIQDAVNDLSVPAHLMTREYNDAVKAALKPSGVYLLTIIDSIEYGKLWRAAMATLKLSFPHVELLTSATLPSPEPPPRPPADADPEQRAEWEDAVRDWERDWRRWEEARQVYVIYAADRPLAEAALREPTQRALGFYARAAVGGAPVTLFTLPHYTHPVPAGRLAPFLARDPGVILTDQYAPVDNLMAEVFRRRNE
jgi:predicted membrane-bound spermidine synthase